ncbi:uncharacterized protein PADG_06242 [Paracoccidioides brasiliensis Pb18]|uniref:Uncharacterized protein n=1 Tax=Paracoccidioides brasiliensis (strain Pb18) TaxID=502780 RepID=C1GG05_PARBD|nr:uncharacterized protein PADG_06242 [Paracoccidioides brasiliensis Pb18]EEH50163.2 hypothetical protein PADG_06242 [Paracoccidioides brasiliensis Pb18]
MSFRPDVAEIPPRPLWDWLLLATCRCYGHQHLSAEEAPFHNCLLPSSRLSLPLVLSKQVIAHHNHSISSRGPLLPLPFLVPLAPVGPRGTLLTTLPTQLDLPLFRSWVAPAPPLPDGYFGPSTFGLIATARPPFQSPAVPCIDAPRSSPAPPQHPFCRTGGTGGTLGGIGGTQWLASPHTPTHSGAETTTHPPCLLDRVGAFPPASVQPYEKPPPSNLDRTCIQLSLIQPNYAGTCCCSGDAAAACCAHLVTGDFAD